jgi:hypothetical protein
MALIAWRLPRSPGLRSDMTFRDWPTLIVVLFLSALMVLIFEPAGILHYNSSGKTAEPAQVPVYADFGEQVALLGYDRSNTSAAAGESIYLTLYWKAQQPLQINYQVFIHVLGPDGLVAQSDKLNPGDFPSRRWPDDKYVRDEHEILLPPDLPPGQYEIATGVWVQSDGWRLPVLDGRGEQVGDRFTLFNLEATGE